MKEEDMGVAASQPGHSGKPQAASRLGHSASVPDAVGKAYREGRVVSADGEDYAYFTETSVLPVALPKGKHK